MKRQKFFLIILILAAGFLRFYKLKELFFFMVDESTVSLVAKRIMIDRRPVLVGADIPGGLQTGPLFYYLTALIMGAAKMNPLGEAIFASGLGVLMVGLFFAVSQKFFSSKRTALLTSLFSAFSCLIIIYNRIYNSLTYSFLAAILAYYALWLLATHSEGSGFSLVLMTILFFAFCRFEQKKIRGLKVFWPFLASFSPLLVFDLRHNFVLWGRVKSFFSFASESSLGAVRESEQLFFPFLEIAKVFSRIFVLSGEPNLSCQILPCQYCLDQTRGFFNPFLLVFSLIIIIFFFAKREKKKLLIKRIIGLHGLSMVIGLFFYRLFMPGYFQEWLLAIFFPAFLLMAGYFFNFLWTRSRLGVIVFLAFFIGANLRIFFSLSNPVGLGTKERAVKYALEQVSGQDFYVDSLGECYGYGGYRYLFWFYGQAPSHSYVDNLYAGWLYSLTVAPAPGLGVVMVSPAGQEGQDFSEKYNFYKEKSFASQQFDGVEVLLVNSKD